MTTYIFASTDSSAADQAAATSGCLYNGTGWTSTQKEIFATNTSTEIILKPGSYAFEDDLRIGSNTILRGANPIAIPTEKKTYLAANPATMAVLKSKTVNGSSTETQTNQQARVTTVDGATNVHFFDLYLQGYCHFKFRQMKDSEVMRCVVNNYHGTYPNGTWANMGYADATGAFWLQGSCVNVQLVQCVAQFSSHHGFCIHYPDGSWAHHITFDDCRALTCGCGMKRGDNSGDIAESAGVSQLQADRPNKGCGDDIAPGAGYQDWACGFDINESICSYDVYLINCLAYDCWKAGYYQEPLKPCYRHFLTTCVGESNGIRATLASGMMVTRESEHSNFYIQIGYLNGCKSINGRKAGYDIFAEYDYITSTAKAQTLYDGKYYRVLLNNCTDCGSRYGVITGPGGAKDVRIDNCTFANNAKRAMNLFGAGPFTVRNVKIKTQNPTVVPIVLGRYCRVNLAESLNANQQASFVAGLTIQTSMTAEVGGTIDGLQAGTPIALIKSSINGDSSYPVTGIALSAGTVDSTDICVGTSGNDPTDVAVVASFALSPSSGTAPLTVQFSDTSTGAPTEWIWTFGDGTGSTAQNPTHTYTTAGTYPVGLTVRDAVSQDTELRQNAVVVGDGSGPFPPTATQFVFTDLGVTPSIVRPGEQVVISFRVTATGG